MLRNAAEKIDELKKSLKTFRDFADSGKQTPIPDKQTTVKPASSRLISILIKIHPDGGLKDGI